MLLIVLIIGALFGIEMYRFLHLILEVIEIEEGADIDYIKEINDGR